MKLKKLRIIAAGMNRSGSTWQFNVIRYLCRSAWPDRSVNSVWIDRYDPDDESEVQIVKAHGQDELAANRFVRHVDDIIVTSFRDIRAVIGSLLRMEWIKPHQAIGYLEIYVRRLDEWEKLSVESMQYEDFIKDPSRSLFKIAQSIGVQADAALLKSILKDVELLKVPDLFHDHTTQLHVRHIGEKINSSAIARLSPDLLNKIEVVYGSWLLKRGYSMALTRL